MFTESNHVDEKEVRTYDFGEPVYFYLKALDSFIDRELKYFDLRYKFINGDSYKVPEEDVTA